MSQAAIWGRQGIVASFACPCPGLVSACAPGLFGRQSFIVGKAGFEPAASASRTLRATKLRHFPAKAMIFVLASLQTHDKNSQIAAQRSPAARRSTHQDRH